MFTANKVREIESLGIQSETAVNLYLKGKGVESPILKKAIYEIAVNSKLGYSIGFMSGDLNSLDADNTSSAKDLFYNKVFEEIKSTFLHEQQHIAQAIASVSKGGNMSLVEQFDLELKKAIKGEKLKAEEIADLKFQSYQNILGEYESRAVQERMSYTQEQLDDMAIAYETKDVSEMIVVSHAEALINEILNTQPEGVQDAIIEKIINYSKEKALERMDNNNQAPKFSFPSERKGFNEWFGDSKIVNPDGTPMVMYHGTKRVFDEFNVKESSQLVDAIFFSPNPEFADNYTKANITDKLSGETLYPSLMPSYISSQNPFDYENPTHVKMLTNSMSGIDIEMMGIANGI